MQREPRGLRGREKLRSILDAARRIVLADGLAQAKMSDIATEAKVSTATVYAYFPSKDDLFRAVVEAVSVDLEVRSPSMPATWTAIRSSAWPGCSWAA